MKKISRGRATFVAMCVLAFSSVTNVPSHSFAQDTPPIVDPAQPSVPLVLAPDIPPNLDSPLAPTMPQQVLTETVASDKLEFTIDETLVRQKALNAAGPDAVTPGEVHPDATTDAVITGRVTAGDTGLPVNNVVVGMYDISRSLINSTSTDRAGVYRLVSYASVTRTVFLRVNPAGIYPYTFAPEWYDNQPTFTNATPISTGLDSSSSNIDFVLDKGAQITGVVTAADTSTPLAGVRVNVIDANGISVDYSDTDAAGQYTTGGLQSGSYRLFFNVNASDAPTLTQLYLSEYYTGQASLATATPISVSAPNIITDVNAALSRGSEITGVVTAEDTDAPMSNARVGLLNADNNNYHSVPTGISGEYAFTGLMAGRYRVSFNPPPISGTPFYVGEYYNDKETFDSAEVISLTAFTTLTDVNAQLNLVGRITGVVTALDTGLPISDVVVVLQYLPPNGFFPPVAYTRTDSQGQYALSANSGRYHLYFGVYTPSPYCGAYYNNAFDFAHGDLVQLKRSTVTPNVNVALTLPGQITGVVTAADTGAPMKDAQVALVSSGVSTRTNVAGQYTLSGVCNGSYNISFSPSPADSAQYVGEYYNDQPGYVSANKVYFRAPAKLTGINAALDRGGFISGTVTAKDTGRPLEGVRVIVYDASPAVGTMTDAKGIYRFSTLRAGAYRMAFNPVFGSAEVRQYAFEFYAHKPSYSDADPVTVSSRKTTVIDTALERMGAITGKISYVDAVSNAAAVITVRSMAGNYVGGDFTNSNGIYTITIAPGAYKVYASPFTPGYAVDYYSDKLSWATADAISVTAGVTTSNINFVFQKGGYIVGRVTDAITGKGVAGFDSVQIYEAGDTRFYTTVSMDSSGYYTSSKPLGTGSYKIRFSGSAHLTQYSGGKTTLAEADVITVTAPTTTTVNASLIPFSALPPRQYFPLMGN